VYYIIIVCNGDVLKLLNLYVGNQYFPLPQKGISIVFESLPIERGEDKRGLLQSIANRLCRQGLDATVAPYNRSYEFDIAIVGVDEKTARQAVRDNSSYQPKFAAITITQDIISLSLTNRIRTNLQQKGFMKSGEKYFHRSELENSNPYKRSFSIQAAFMDNKPCVWIDPSTRIVEPLSDELIAKASSSGEQSNIGVRLLPFWSYGILEGKAGKKACEMQFPIGQKTLAGPQYWRAKHGIGFVKENEDMLSIIVPPSMRKNHYPRSCVFKEYSQGRQLPPALKKSPSMRISEAGDFVRANLNGLSFLGQRVIFDGPVSPGGVGFKEVYFGSEPGLLVGGGHISSSRAVHQSLRLHGPYSGKLDGKYFIIHCGHEDEVLSAAKEIEKTYSSLNLGKIEPLNGVDNSGLIDSQGDSVTDYTSAIAALRMKPNLNTRAIGIIVLPDQYSSDVYFRSRGQLFERIYGTPPFPAQAIRLDSIKSINRKAPSSNPICINTAAQLYIKFGGTGTALWTLSEAADAQIPGVQPGTSCYAYYDVSRRYKIKSSATAYSALTDSYGRYIATGTRPIGGERISDSSFYDVLVELIQKISIFSQRYRQIDANKSFNFQRLVFAKDGIIAKGEAEMMEYVIENGIPSERKEPIAKVLEKNAMLPKSLIIDIIGVNKNPNKRVFESTSQAYSNVNIGTTIINSENSGLLISASTFSGTAQPIEITLAKHVCLNKNVPTPSVSDVIKEYYHLTFLNWSSIFKKSKYSLPQILTQNLGENLTAGTIVPDDMVLL
jgi:hypothetical protein